MDAGLAGVFKRIDSLTDDPTILNGYKLQQPLNLQFMDEGALHITGIYDIYVYVYVLYIYIYT